jgi:hypothetical protein
VGGWTKEGREVELLPAQEFAVKALLSREMTILPARPEGCGWSVILATTARLDAEGIDPGPADPADLIAAAGLDPETAELFAEWYGHVGIWGELFSGLFSRPNPTGS